MTQDESKQRQDEQVGQATQHSIIRFLESKTGEAPNVSLRDEESASVAAPLIDPSSKEKLSIPGGRGNYQLLGEIARGGMGVIMKAHDGDLGRDVAVKVLDKRLSERMDVVQRFVEEAQIGGQLQHPGIVPVYELGMMADERPYFTMKLVKGRTLAALLAAREAPSSNRGHLIEVFESVCQTMAYAHSRGVIHRDLKPANIMVGAFGEVQVVDWGLAKVLVRGGTADEKLAREAHTQMTVLETVRSDGSSTGTDSMVGSILGTPAYMPPEQASGLVDRLDERSDVFALGAILCEILTGLPPYHGERDHVISAAAQAELEEAFARLEACGADAALVKIARQCLTAAPAARPANAGVLAERVHDHVISVGERAHQAEVAAAAAEVKARAERRARILTLALGAAVLAALLLGGGGWLLVQNERAAQARAETERVQAAAEHERALNGQVNEALTAASIAAGAEDFNGALVAAERARALAQGGGAGDEFLASVDGVLTNVRASMEAARQRDELRVDTQRLLAELREVERPSEESDVGFKADAFRSTFLAHSIDLDAGTLEAAAEQLTRRGLGSEVARALDSWGDDRREEDDVAGAQRLLELAHAIDPDPERMHLRDALFERDLKELRFLATADLADQPASTIALLASALLRLDEVELALDVFRAGIDEHPDDFELHYLLARWLTPRVVEPGVREELVEAAQHFRAAIALQPDSGWAHLYLGRVLEKLGDRERGLVHNERALELEPDNGEFRMRLAQAQWRLERLDEAKANFERILADENPGWARGWSQMYLSNIAILRGIYAPVPAMVRDGWLAGNSENWDGVVFILTPLSRLSLATGDEAPVLELLQLLEPWKPWWAEPRNRLAWHFVRLVGGILRPQDEDAPAIADDLRQALLGHAVELAKRATELDPEQADFWNTLGLAHYCAGDFASALAALQQEHELLGDGQAGNLLCLAMAEHRLGNEDLALDLYRRAILWMATHDTDENLRWFQAEAQRVLGV